MGTFKKYYSTLYSHKAIHKADPNYWGEFWNLKFSAYPHVYKVCFLLPLSELVALECPLRFFLAVFLLKVLTHKILLSRIWCSAYSIQLTRHTFPCSQKPPSLLPYPRGWNSELWQNSKNSDCFSISLRINKVMSSPIAYLQHLKYKPFPAFSFMFLKDVVC